VKRDNYIEMSEDGRTIFFSGHCVKDKHSEFETALVGETAWKNVKRWYRNPT